MTDYSTLSTQQLINYCLQGKKRAWNVLIDRYEDYIYSLTRRYIADRDLCNDVFQNVFLILYKNLSRLRNKDLLSAYLFQITRNESLRVLRNEKRESPEEESVLIELGYDKKVETPEGFFLHIEERILISDAVKQLPQKCQMIVNSLFFQDNPLSYRELAESLRMPESSIGPTRQRCLEKLKEILQKMGVI